MGVCEECGYTFILTKDECAILTTMRPGIRKQDDAPRIIRNWADWVEHCSTHCPECRYPSPPRHSQEDLDKHQGEHQG